MKTKNNLLKAGVIILVSLLSCTTKTEQKKQEKHEKSKPNIVLICADDMGWSDIGCYGGEIETPNIDKLADRGMRFLQFHNTAKCFPSRACLLTGVYAQECGYDKTYTNPIQNAVTLGEVLREAGYRTMWSGKHHGKENPIYRGFDRYYGLKDGCCNYFNPGVKRDGEPAPAHKDRIREWCIDSTMYKPYTPVDGHFYTTDYFTNHALSWLDEYKDEEKPFFLYLAYTAPHDPLMAWPEDIAKYKGKYNVGYGKIRKQRYKKQQRLGLIDERYKLSDPTFTPWEQLDDTRKQEEAQTMEVYAAMIDRLDQNIGRILSKLKELGKDKNTLILFVSDNGASAEVTDLETDDDTAEIGSMARWSSLGKDWANVCNTPFRYYKNYSYEGGINTPFIAYWPKEIKPNSFSEFPGHFIDFMATFVDLANAKYPEEFNGQLVVPYQGQSLLPVFKGNETHREQPIYWAWSKGKALRHNNWKIVKHGIGSNWDLYDMDKDPTEINDLSEIYPDTLQSLDSLYEKWYSKYYN